MKYEDIPKGVRKYIRRSTYEDMNFDEKRIYLGYILELIHKLDDMKADEDIVEPMVNLSINRRKVNKRTIKFVGMRFYGDHVFSKDDEVKLALDDEFFRPHSLRVLLKKRKKWKHVAYVERGDAKWLHAVGYKNLPLEFHHASNGSATYNIDLTPLSDSGFTVKTKTEVLGRFGLNRYYLFDELWHNYPDVDYLDFS